MSTLTQTKEQLLLDKLLQSRNFLDYTGLTYEDLIVKINQKIAADASLDSFRESAVAQTMIEIFAGVVDLCNHYIERRAEECYFDTARLKSSVILLSRQLAYDVQRSVPAEARLKVILKGNLGVGGANVTAGDKIQIPQYIQFTGEGKPFILKTMFEYTITSEDIAAGSELNKEITINELTESNSEDKIVVVQGEIKSAKISGASNNQVGQIFQTFRINDKEFSNIYGTRDFADGNITRVGIGVTQQEAFSNDNEFTVDRRSLLKVESLETFNFQNPTPQKICLIRTSTDEGVDVKFGDGNYAAKGLINSSQNLFIQYLATKGSQANKTGVIDNKVQISKAVKTVANIDVSNYVEFKFASNIVGGSDLESIESIKSNAPAIFYSLDRLVTKCDYENFLKTLTSPLVIRNAIAWGEQEEIYLQNITSVDEASSLAIKKLFNVVLFCCLGSLYNTDTNVTEFSPIENVNEVTLDAEDSSSLVPSQNYMNVFVAQNIVQQLKYQNNASEGEAQTSQKIIGEPVRYPVFTDLVANSPYGMPVRLSVDVEEIDGGDTFTINLSAGTHVVGVLNQSSYEAIAERIEDSLYDTAAFSAVIPDFSPFTYVKVQYVTDHFEIRFIDSNYKITKIWDGLESSYALDNTITRYNILGLGEGNYQDTFSFTGKAFSYSDKIEQVVRQLDQRCQLTVKNIYVSPIIHKFDINGNIYCRSLVDKDALHTAIKNKVYVWADRNADFNKPIYISNIIELIESFPDVVRADVKLTPRIETPQLPATTFFNYEEVNNLMASFYSTWNASDHNTIRQIILQRMISFITANTNTYLSTTPPIIGVVDKMQQIISEATSSSSYNLLDEGKRGEGMGLEYAQLYNLYIKGESFASKITERSFYYQLVKTMYDSFVSVNIVNQEGWKFEESPDFYELVNQIHQDLSWIIRFNMIDSYGNIAPQTTTTTINNQTITKNIGGGYTLGNEIVQLWMNTQTQYMR